MQIELFRNIHDDEGHQLTHNFRPIQPIGDRQVWFVSEKPDFEDNQLEIIDDVLEHDAFEYSREFETTESAKNDSLSAKSAPVDPSNHLDHIEETTTHHPKAPKLRGKNSATKKQFGWIIPIVVAIGIAVSQC